MATVLISNFTAVNTFGNTFSKSKLGVYYNFLMYDSRSVVSGKGDCHCVTMHNFTDGCSKSHAASLVMQRFRITLYSVKTADATHSLPLLDALGFHGTATHDRTHVR
ncbi:hypothetical protein PoB_006588400 [Plakobranchus ocellatus]|uniref:Uncharacterized protein n=1 Tax=Plakobranchus ocellatus TaxID=259542 RepID=A0AAV4D5D3_9GAST|nr:hypothetical protein PoB_006588400 [Plakobranchus ocellatus]